MNNTFLNRLLISVWVIFLPIADLAIYGKWERIADAWLLVLMVYLGWKERDNGIKSEIKSAMNSDLR